jgi:hypothetical protein
MDETRSAYETLVGTSEGKRPFANCKWEHNIKIDLKVMGWDVADRIHLAQDGN